MPVAGEVYRALGEEIRRRRDKAGLSQAALGSRVGLGRTSITNIEGGAQTVLLHQFIALAEALRASPVDLLNNIQRPSTERQGVRETSGQLSELLSRLEKRGGAK